MRESGNVFPSATTTMNVFIIGKRSVPFSSIMPGVGQGGTDSISLLRNNYEAYNHANAIVRLSRSRKQRECKQLIFVVRKPTPILIDNPKVKQMLKVWVYWSRGSVAQNTSGKEGIVEFRSMHLRMRRYLLASVHFFLVGNAYK